MLKRMLKSRADRYDDNIVKHYDICYTFIKDFILY